MNKSETQVTDLDLLMLYYGEHSDPGLASRVADSPQLSARLDQLSRELGVIETAPLPDPGADYGQRVWQQLVPELTADTTVKEPSWVQKLLAPRLSFAGLAAMVAVAALAFFMGQNSRVAEPGQLTMDSQALLTRELALHLQRAEVLLTEVANSTTTSAAASHSAQPLLTANRLYRIAGGSEVNPQLGSLLQDMETLLLELSNASAGDEMGTLKDYVDSDLLFRVRSLRNTLSDVQEQRI